MENAPMPSHMHRRGAVYYTRMMVPPRLRAIIGKSDIGRSLGTSDYREAVRLQPVWLAEALAMIDAAEAELARRQQAALVVNGPQTQEEADWLEEQDRFNRELEWEYEAQVEADDAVEAKLLHPTADLTPDEAAAARLIREARKERDRYRDRYRVRKRRDQGNGQSEPQRIREPINWTRPMLSPEVTITGIFEGYAAQEGSKTTTVKQFRAIIDHLVAFLGHDDAKAVGLRELVKWREHLRVEPTKNGKPRSAKTINDSYLAAVSAMFSYGLNQLLIPANPAKELAKVKVTKAAKLRDRDFTKVERKAILTAALVPASANLSPQRALASRWVPWICAYSGARVNEITQLRKEDVQKIEGIWTIRITPEAGGNKMNEARIVPVHEHLIAQGFWDAIKDLPDGPLFYNPEHQRGGSDRGQYKKVGMFLADWVRNTVGIKDKSIMPNHAWRHTFKTICFEAEVEERAADYMQGHASKGQGRRYGANTIPALAAQLAKFPRFEGANTNLPRSERP
jgi:integrase